MSDSVDLTNHFLIAMPGMIEGDLAGTVIYMCEHSDRGALGLVINRPIDMTLSNLLQRVDLPAENSADETSDEVPVYFGGPVQTDRGFVLHRPHGQYSSSIHLENELALTTSRDVLQDVAAGQGPEQLFVTLGYAGWGAGQLEQELAQNSWLSVPADEAIIFDTPVDVRYPAAMRLLGIDPAMLAGSAGHA